MELQWRDRQSLHNYRRREHERNVENYKSGSNIANHEWKNDHRIDFVTGKIIDKQRQLSTQVDIRILAHCMH